jgi:short-subunit dehydrogenase
MKTQLSGKTAVITGASRGLGRLIAHNLAREGVSLLLAARSLDDLEKVRAELAATGAQVQANFQANFQVIAVDLSHADQVQHLFDSAQAALGQIDILINNVGIIDPDDYEQTDPAHILQSLAVNLAAPMLLTRQVLPAMLARNQGHIVNVASIAGFLPCAWGEVYATTKHGLIGFTRSLRMKLKVIDSGVRISLVCPGFIEGVGMYADRLENDADRAPLLVGTSDAQRVAQAVVDSLKSSREEIIVSPWQTRLLCTIYNLAPGMHGWLMRKINAHHVFSNLARKKQRGQQK